MAHATHAVADDAIVARPALRPLARRCSRVCRVVPAAFVLDLFDGEAWLGVVPFRMTNVGLRATPTVPWISAFAELNVRTYVRVADRPGVVFF